MTVPAQPKIYHIVHVDRLASIVANNGLFSDSVASLQNLAGTAIGMSTIKQRRLNELTLNSHPNLYVGECVPFYFCPRSIMLYMLHRRNNEELTYRGGQEPIVHLQADLHASIQWADQQQRRWAFTLSNAGSYFFEDRNNLEQLNELDWAAIASLDWRSHKEGKQAEFLMEESFPWHLIEAIGVQSTVVYNQVVNTIQTSNHRPPVALQPNWYY